MTSIGRNATVVIILAAVLPMIVIGGGPIGCGGTGSYVNTQPPPVTVTSVSVTATPNAITTAQTAQCVGTVHYSDGTTSAKVSYTATGGTITSSGVFTPTTVGNDTCTATSTEDASKSDSATIVVTQAPPAITAIDETSAYCEEEACEAQFTLTTANALATDTVTVSPANSNAISASPSDANHIVVTIFFNTFAPTWYTFQACRADKSQCSNIVASVLLAPQNTLTCSNAGECFQVDQTKTAAGYYVRKFKANGSTLTPDGDFLLPWKISPMSISYDDKTSTIDIGGIFLDANGNGVGGVMEPSSLQGQPFGTATKNGYGGFTQPTDNDFFGYPIAGGLLGTPISMGCQPSSLAVGTVDTETDALVLSRDCAVTLWRQGLSSSTESSMPLAGITPASSVGPSNSTGGGWQVAYAETGPATGTVAVLSTPDNGYIVFANAATMQETKNVTLGDGIWNQVAADNVHGTFVVASANPQTPSTEGSTTTFAAVNPRTGTVTPLASTSNLFAAGFAVSIDGNWLYICSLSACETQPNK